jgi:hypothetical protein
MAGDDADSSAACGNWIVWSAELLSAAEKTRDRDKDGDRSATQQHCVDGKREYRDDDCDRRGGGCGLGIGLSRYLKTLFYEVKATDLSMLSLPLLMLAATAIIATMPAVLRGVRTEPSEILRSE